MASFDNAALRVRVVSEYDSLMRGVTDADEMARVFDIIMDTAITATREAMRVSNSLNPAVRLPGKILAACFTCLPFSDRFRVSHVCFAWRSAALASPEVWSNISLGRIGADGLELLVMAFHRSGSLPVDLEVHKLGKRNIEVVDEVVDTVLKPHLRRLRSVSWSPQEQSTLWTRSAPMLERLDCFHGLAVGQRFLGSQPGRLISLRIRFCALPVSCPALSTIEDLRIRDMHLSPDPASFHKLFKLLPRLKSLHLGGLKRRFAHHLPPRPAPASLRELTLETSSSGYDLMSHCLAWDAHRFRAVSLKMGYVGELDIRPLLRNAIVLRIGCPSGTAETQLMSEHPDSTSRFFGLYGAFSSRWRFGKHFLAARDELQNVHTVALSHVALEEFLPVAAQLPVLEHLVVHIRSTRLISHSPEHHEHSDDGSVASEDNAPPRYLFDWLPLNHLQDLPRLASLTLQVCRMHDREPPISVGDAVALLHALASIDTHSLPHIAIEGFPDAPAYLHGLRLSFYTAAEVGPVVFSMPRPHAQDA